MVWLERKWVIPDTEEVGTVVTKVRGQDAEGDSLVYGLEYHTGFNIQNPVVDQKPLPFRIDNRTGVVYTNESLLNRVSKNYITY